MHSHNQRPRIFRLGYRTSASASEPRIRPVRLRKLDHQGFNVQSTNSFVSQNTTDSRQYLTMALSFNNQPPQARVPYAVPQLEGERITIPGSKGVFRILASSKQTNGLMAVFQSGAVLSDAPGFHYHNHAHDVFLVAKGYLKLWNGDKCRIMGPGDFAYVPPVCLFAA